MPVVQTTTPNGNRLLINVRREATAIMECDAGTTFCTEFTFDYEGRLVGAFIEGRNYRRSLDNRILEKQSGLRPGLSSRLRRLLDPAEVRALEDRAYAYVLALEMGADGTLDEDTHQALNRINSYNYHRLQRESEHFNHIYRPIPILPPDQYLALYLQATEGCSYNECSFCGLYRDRRFHIKTAGEFRSHLLDVRSFFGGGLTLRRSIFLGDANALIIPQDQLIPLLDQINAEFAILPRGLDDPTRRAWLNEHPIRFDGIYSFIDAFTTRRKTARDFAELAARGLRRVYLGLESGDPALLRFLGKPHDPADVSRLVNELKAGGVAVGLIILVGAGGGRFDHEHVRATAALVNSLPLDEQDLIYFSELVDYAGSSYIERAAAAGIRALTPGEIDHQMVRLRAGFNFSNPAHAPKVSFYDIREFVY